MKIIFIVLSLLITACGGGGGSSDNSTSTAKIAPRITNLSKSYEVYENQNAAFTVSTGVITAFTGITLYSLFSESFTTYSTVSLGDAVSHVFEGLNKTIYLYAVSSTVSPSLTISYSSE